MAQIYSTEYMVDINSVFNPQSLVHEYDISVM